MFDDLPCSTDGCGGSAPSGRATCEDCHVHDGFPAGYTRAMDEAWLNYTPCDKIRAAA